MLHDDGLNWVDTITGGPIPIGATAQKVITPKLLATFEPQLWETGGTQSITASQGQLMDLVYKDVVLTKRCLLTMAGNHGVRIQNAGYAGITLELWNGAAKLMDLAYQHTDGQAMRDNIGWSRAKLMDPGAYTLLVKMRTDPGSSDVICRDSRLQLWTQ